MKRIWISIFIICALFTLTSCADLDLLDVEENEDNFFVYDGTTAQRLIPVDEPENHTEPYTYPLLVSTEDADAIPAIREGLNLVANTDSEIDDEMKIFRLEDLGVSLGLICENTSVPGLYAISQKSRDTDPETGLLVQQRSRIRLSAIGGERIGENQLSEFGTFTGLKKNKPYTVTYVSGSKVRRRNLNADTEVFKVNTDQVGTARRGSYTDNGYVFFELPQLENGYYMIDSEKLSTCLFKVENEVDV